MSYTKEENLLRIVNSELNSKVATMEESLLINRRAGEALIESETRYRRLFESAKDGILILDADSGKVVDVNPFLLQLLGYAYEELCGQFIWSLGVFKDIAASKDAFKTLQENEYIRYDDLPLETREGKAIAVEFVSNVYLVNNIKVIQCNIRDITDRKSASAERTRLMAAINQIGEAIVITDDKGDIQFVNPAFSVTTGYDRDEVIGRNPRLLNSSKQDELFYRTLWNTISSGNTWKGRMINKRKNGSLYTDETTISPVRDASDRIVNYVAVNRDITEHLLLADQYQQAQKMEAIGLLAGGVAHDYNNMLTVILGYAELAMNRTDSSGSLRGNLEEIIRAAKRSSEITRQLLTFARKQTIVPVSLDLNQAVENTLKMLRRLVGEDISLAWLPATGNCPIKIDPVQIDQILANLCVNARDAIANTGKITIETGNTVFDATYCAHHVGYVEGNYVLLAVSDDGCGMDKEMLKQIFEPFFSSKGVGQGTGLGLSTVYGIVKQNNGFINVYSEPGNGTTFRIYLPWDSFQVIGLQEVCVEKTPVGHGETVLLVEDEPALLKLGVLMLEELGYRVLAAGTPAAAIDLAHEHNKEIKLLITDVIMPEMNCRELAEQLQLLYPAMKTLFMSGYTTSVISQRGVLDDGVSFIQKPFSMRDIAIKVNGILG